MLTGRDAYRMLVRDRALARNDNLAHEMEHRRAQRTSTTAAFRLIGVSGSKLPAPNRPTTSKELVDRGVVLALSCVPLSLKADLAMADNPDWKLTITGHTDNIGGDKYNLDLSQRRSAAVKRALVERYHEDPNRLSTAGRGDSSPLTTNDTLEGRARNRRVELTLE